MKRTIQMQGLTLVELTTSLAVAAVLISIAIPALKGFLERYESRAQIENLRMMLYTVRSQAIISSSSAVLCPLSASGQCHRDWNKPLTAFSDPNKNRILDTGEVILGTVKASPEYVWRSYPKTAFAINERGYANFSNGTLGYCRVLSGGTFTSAAFIISRMGRIRMGGDKNDNGITENGSAKEIPCPT